MTGERFEPIIFITVVELISRKISAKDMLWKLLYADDLAMVADVEADLPKQLIITEWKDMFSRHGLRVSLHNTEIVWVVQRRKELEIHLYGKKF